MEANSNEWLDFLATIGANGTTSYTSTTVKKIIKTDDKPVISIPVDKLFELYGNLVLAGFERDEALIIVVGIASHAREE
jgi:hypothetical protein